MNGKPFIFKHSMSVFGLGAGCQVAVVDAEDRLLAKYVTRWWRSGPEGADYVDPQVLTSHREHIRCLAESAMAALRQVGVARMRDGGLKKDLERFREIWKI